MFGPDTPTVVRGCSALKSVVTLAETTLTVDDPGYGVRTMRVSRQGAPLIKPRGERSNAFSISLIAEDPRKFGPALTASTALPSSTGGFTFPATFPLTVNATTASGSVSLTNAGDIAGPVTLRIAGPVSAPAVLHTGPDGRRTLFAMNVVLGAGEYLDVDMEAQTVTAQGTASRSRFVTARGWQSFRPGANSWTFTADYYDPAALLSVTTSSTWE